MFLFVSLSVPISASRELLWLWKQMSFLYNVFPLCCIL